MGSSTKDRLGLKKDPIPSQNLERKDKEVLCSSTSVSVEEDTRCEPSEVSSMEKQQLVDRNVVEFLCMMTNGEGDCREEKKMVWLVQ